jgi:chemotaxis response regulator CheB
MTASLAAMPVLETSSNARIVVADHSPDYLDLLVLLLDAMPTLDVVGRTLNGEEAVRMALELDADVALLEVQMWRLDGFDAAAEIRRARPETVVLLHTRNLDEELRDRADALDLFVFEKLDLVKSLEVLDRLGQVESRNAA